MQLGRPGQSNELNPAAPGYCGHVRPLLFRRTHLSFAGRDLDVPCDNCHAPNGPLCPRLYEARCRFLRRRWQQRAVARAGDMNYFPVAVCQCGSRERSFDEVTQSTKGC